VQPVDLTHPEQHGVHEVLDEQDVAHLHAVAVQHDRRPSIARIRKWATQPWSSVPN
jgi:hypothetical protein